MLDERPSRLARAWRGARVVAAVPGLVTPLTLAGLSRGPVEILGAVLGATVLGWAIGRRRANAGGLGFAAYVVGCAALAIATRQLLPTVDDYARARVAGTAALLTAVVVLDGRATTWRSWLGPARSARGLILGDLLVLGVGAVVIRVGMHGLFTNTGLTSALLLMLPMMVVRRGWLATLVWMASATSAAYGWHGFMNGAEYPAHVDPSPPAGVSIAVLSHGDPTSRPGARFFRPGTCPTTSRSFYAGEAARTYRLEPDGAETVLLDGVESSQTLVERCDRHELLVASFERKLLRLARLDDGQPLRDLELPSHPATMLLDTERDTLYVSTSLPASVVQIDLAAWRIVRVLDRYLERDPHFSGIVNLVRVGDRLVGAYSSWYLIDPAEGEVFSVDGDLGDFRILSRFMGAWGYLIPDPRDPGALYLKAYYRPELWHIGQSGSEARVVAQLSPGAFYGVALPDLGLLVFDHWTSGALDARCLSDPSRPLRVQTGGMGRMLWGEADRIYTPSASGYVTITFPAGACAP